MWKAQYVANSQFRHTFFHHALVYEYSDRSPTHVVLQVFAYKTATPREATSTLEYLRKKNFNLSACSNLYPGKLVVLKPIQHQPGNGNQQQAINKVIWYVPDEHYALAAGTSSVLRRPPKSSPCTGDPVRRMVSRPSTQKPLTVVRTR